MNPVVKAYEAYPLTDVNKYNIEINSKRLGYQQGYEQCEKDFLEKLYVYLVEKNYFTEDEAKDCCKRLEEQ